MGKKILILAILAAGMAGHCDAGFVDWAKSKRRNALENRADKIKTDTEARFKSFITQLNSFTEKHPRLDQIVKALKKTFFSLNFVMSPSKNNVDREKKTIETLSVLPAKHSLVIFNIDQDKQDILKYANNFGISKLLAMQAAINSGADTTSKECDWLLRRSRQLHMDQYKIFFDDMSQFINSTIKSMNEIVAAPAYHDQIKKFLRKPEADIAGMEKAAKKLSAGLEEFMEKIISEYNLLSDLDGIKEKADVFELDTALDDLRKKYEAIGISDIGPKDPGRKKAITDITNDYIKDASKIYGTVVYTELLLFEPTKKEIEGIVSPVKKRDILAVYKKNVLDSMVKKFLFIPTKLIKGWQKKFRKRVSTSLAKNNKITGNVLISARGELRALCTKFQHAHNAAAKKAADSAGVEYMERMVAEPEKAKKVEATPAKRRVKVTPIGQVGTTSEASPAKSLEELLEEPFHHAEYRKGVKPETTFTAEETGLPEDIEKARRKLKKQEEATEELERLVREAEEE